MPPPNIRTIRGWLTRQCRIPRDGKPSRLSIAAGVTIKLRAKGNLTIGCNANIETGVILDTQNGHIHIGDNCGLNPNVILYGFGGIIIGNDVRIAANTVIVSANHIFDDPNTLIRKQGMRAIGITIENDVWIGANCTILDGAHISEGCVIAAGSVVRGRTSAYGIYGGVPAKLLKSRLQS